MLYQAFKPSYALSPFVEDYLLMQPAAGLNQPEQIPPGGKSGLTLNLGADYQIKLLGVTQKIPPVAIGGQLTQVMELTKPGSGQLLMIKFTPTGLYQLLGLPILELTNQLTPIDTVVSLKLRQQWSSLVDQLRELDQPHDRIRLVDDYLLTYLNRTPPYYTWVDAATSWLAQPGERQIQHLVSEFRISPRQLTREFSRQVGLSPKRYAQLMRFSNVCRAAFSPTSPTWQELVHLGGWYDQAHFCNDIYRLTGQTPTAFFAQHHVTAQIMIQKSEVPG